MSSIFTSLSRIIKVSERLNFMIGIILLLYHYLYVPKYLCSYHSSSFFTPIYSKSDWRKQLDIVKVLKLN